MSILVMLSPAPVIEARGGEVMLDARFVEGMKLHAQLWPGRVCCLMRRGAATIPDPVRFARSQLPFELVLTDPGKPPARGLLDQATLVYCAADDMAYLALAEAMRGRIGRLVYTVEQSLAERMAAGLRADRPLRQRLGGAFWNLRHEIRFRRALRGADGVHLNGLAAGRYRRLNAETLVYLDNRIRQPLLARTADQEARAERLRAGAPLRLVAVGPWTRESGVEDLVAMAGLLGAAGVAFELELIGEGPQEGALRAAIARLGPQAPVRLSPPMPFEGRLLPHLRTGADIALMPRRLPEAPSAYVEAMGCGLPVLAYATPGWRGLQRVSGAGWSLRRTGPAALAARIAGLDRAREQVIAASGRALDHARETTFEKVFARRMDHLRRIARLDQP